MFRMAAYGPGLQQSHCGVQAAITARQPLRQAPKHGRVLLLVERGPAHRCSRLQAALDQLHGASQQAYGHAGARARKELVAYGELRSCTLLSPRYYMQ